MFGYAAAAQAGAVPALVNQSVTAVVMWVLTAYFTAGAERLIMTPNGLVLTVLYLILATE